MLKRGLCLLMALAKSSKLRSSARSYPDNVPEFGKSYSAVITFYLNDGSERKWQGSVEWKKTESGATVRAVSGSATLSFSPYEPVDINTNLRFSEGHAGGVAVLVYSLMQLVWGYRIYLDFEGYSGDPKANGLIGNFWKRDPHHPNLYYRDFKAEYTLMSSGYYVQSDPQHIVVDELKANEWYYYKIFPLCNPS